MFHQAHLELAMPRHFCVKLVSQTMTRIVPLLANAVVLPDTISPPARPETATRLPFTVIRAIQMLICHPQHLALSATILEALYLPPAMEPVMPPICCVQLDIRTMTTILRQNVYPASLRATTFLLALRGLVQMLPISVWPARRILI